MPEQDEGQKEKKRQDRMKHLGGEKKERRKHGRERS